MFRRVPEHARRLLSLRRLTGCAVEAFFLVFLSPRKLGRLSLPFLTSFSLIERSWCSRAFFFPPAIPRSSLTLLWRSGIRPHCAQHQQGGGGDTRALRARVRLTGPPRRQVVRVDSITPATAMPVNLNSPMSYRHFFSGSLSVFVLFPRSF